MTTTVLPLPAILLQFLFILIAIAIESFIFHNFLKLSRKLSVFYAASINLISTVLGWLIFFNIQFWFPPALKAELISYIFFDRFTSPALPNFTTLIIMTGFLTFFTAFWIKLKSLNLVEYIINYPKPQPTSIIKKNIKSRSRNQKNQTVLGMNSNRATIILLANACTHSAILLILLLRIIFINR